MSHEGIRFISKEEALAAAAQDDRLPREAVTPAKVRVHMTTGEGVEIEWKDGHQSKWSFPWLRDACPCATCHEERQHTGRKLGEAKAKPAEMFAMYQAPAKPMSVEKVGNYALKFKWNDGHEAGIYSWDHLRRVCNCEACRSKQA
ncbi:DUF971 domain-containing protein [Terriglobus tenax]|uniref:DUF971 domain-containing protein n=1 Tax=Terriglobus tenax TaxID=1111115 RepID=UPI0021E0D19B|nr:DUF971 domain-containing protein [Terriglobus tenax]